MTNLAVAISIDPEFAALAKELVFMGGSLNAAGTAVLATDCPLAAVHFDQMLGRRPIHPIQVLARAYRPDGFPTRIEGQERN